MRKELEMEFSLSDKIVELEKEMSRMVDKLLQYVGQYLPAKGNATSMDFSDPVSPP